MNNLFPENQRTLINYPKQQNIIKQVQKKELNLLSSNFQDDFEDLITKPNDFVYLKEDKSNIENVVLLEKSDNLETGADVKVELCDETILFPDDIQQDHSLINPDCNELIFPGETPPETSHTVISPILPSYTHDYFKIENALSELNTSELKHKARESLGINGDQLSKIYTFKGSKSYYYELPTKDNSVGDVWYIENSFILIIDSVIKQFDEGNIVCWEGKNWCVLGKISDIFKYAINLCDVNGNPIQLENYRGDWSLDIATSKNPYISNQYYYDSVTHNGSVWMCNQSGTKIEPSEKSYEWYKKVSKGSDSITSVYKIKPSVNILYYNTQLSTNTITVKVGEYNTKGYQEITDQGILNEKGLRLLYCVDNSNTYFQINISQNAVFELENGGELITEDGLILNLEGDIIDVSTIQDNITFYLVNKDGIELDIYIIPVLRLISV